MDKRRNSDLIEWYNKDENSTEFKIKRLLRASLEKIIQDDKNKFSKVYIKNVLDLINLNSIADVKQLLFILNYFDGKDNDFRHLSDDDVLLYLTNIISSFDDPLPKLIEAFDKKELCFLPTKIHNWLIEDLSNVLYFAHDLQVPEIMNSAFVNGDEITNALSNFLLFNVIEYDEESDDYLINPITDILRRERRRFISQFEGYKKWYLKDIEPRDSYKWLYKLDEGRIDNIIADLKKKDVMILTDVFYPKSLEDKICLIIACLNNISKESIFEIVNQFDNVDIEQEVYINQNAFYNVVEYFDYYILEDSNKFLNYDEEKYQGLSIPSDMYLKLLIENAVDRRLDICIDDEFKPLRIYLNENNYNLQLISKKTKKYSVLGRDKFIPQVKNANRQQRKRDKEALLEEDRTINLSKKNWSILKKLSNAQNITMTKFINNLFETANNNYEKTLK